MSKSSLASGWTNLAPSGGAGANDVLVQTLKDWRDKRPELFKKRVYNLSGLETHPYPIRLIAAHNPEIRFHEICKNVLIT